ncbi:protein VAPYRIN-LIKE-like [Tasmannia lanceolata]|uniref:protein VAPYRIN-LIKE-like n=1 Tax=Tasmannia lanceolata TaxID=3420 RepID=UPI004063DAD0
MEKLVEVSEQEVCIEFKLGCKCRANINLKSLTHLTPIAFKVQTSSPHKFLVNPPNGLIPPLSSTSFQVILKPQTQIPSTFPRSPSDRFLIKTTPANDLQTNPTSQNDNSLNMWFSSPTHVTHDIKLKVVYVGPFLLSHSIATGDADAVKHILRRQKSGAAQLPSLDIASLLEAAATSRNPNMLNLLVEAGLKLETLEQVPNCTKPYEESELESKSKPKPKFKVPQNDSEDKEALMLSKGWVPIHLAAASDRYDVLSALIEDAKVGELDCRDKQGRTPLHLATSKESLRCVRQLVEGGANKNAKSNDGRTAMFRAAANGDPAMVALLLDMGADPNIGTNDSHSQSPLDIARDKGHKEVVEILERGELVLMAARRGDLNRLESLLRKGVGIKCCDQYGLTALHSAAIKGHANVVAMLIEFGMDLECEDAEGHTPLHLAVEGGSIETIEVLLDRGADVNARSKRGATPLYMAASMGYDYISQILIKRGANSSCLPSSSSSLSSS